LQRVCLLLVRIAPVQLLCERIIDYCLWNARGSRAPGWSLYLVQATTT